MAATHSDAVPRAARARAAIAPHWRPLVPGLVVVALLGLWAIHNGGYDADTWYWGALLVLALLTGTVIALGGARGVRLPRSAWIALAALAAYTAWSYLSIAWAGSQADALQGSNRAMLYLLVFALMLVLPWTAQSALTALVAYALTIGGVGVVILLRLASHNRVSGLVIDGRLTSPTGYFNSTTALFSIGAGLGIVLASRRELPGLLRGLLLGCAAADLELAVIGQSRGWLFTLPIVAVAVIVIVRDRLRVAVAAVVPIAAAVIPVHRLLGVFDSSVASQLNQAASRAGRAALILTTATVVIGALAAWSEQLIRPRSVSVRAKRIVGTALVALAIIVGAAGFTAATHGDPLHFISRQWNGFSHPPTSSPTGSHFATVGSGRYDFWRVSLDALVAHPLGGLGQDNFSEYYITRRRTNEEPAWTHSFEMRLLAHTGLVGFGLFAVFLGAAFTGVAAARRRSRPLASAAAGAAAAPVLVWLIHGSVDWFWEFPALSGPALGFLAVAIALGRERAVGGGAAGHGGARDAGARDAGAGDGGARDAAADAPAGSRAPVAALAGVPAPVRIAVGAVAVAAIVVALGFPYLSVREVSLASDARAKNTATALHDLSRAAKLDPTSAVPGRVAGTIALQIGNLNVAESRFQQAIDRDPGGWYAWFGRGLAASALGDAPTARHDFAVAAGINNRQPVVREALARVDTTRPLTPSEALAMLVVVH